MIELRSSEPPFNVVLSGRCLVVDLVPETFAEINAPASASRTLIGHLCVESLAANRDLRSAATPPVLMGARHVICEAIPLT